MENENLNEAGKPALSKGEVTSRFTVTIHDDNGEVSVELIDYATRTKVSITNEEMKQAKGFGVGSLAKLIIKATKDKYREIERS